MNDREIRESKLRIMEKVADLLHAAEMLDDEMGSLADEARASGLTHHMLPLLLAKGHTQSVIATINNMASMLPVNVLSIAMACEGVAPDDFLKEPEQMEDDE